MNTLYWPSGPYRYQAWCDYIPEGFRRLGFEVVYDPKLREDSLIGGTYHFAVEQDGKKETAWYDFRDFVKTPVEFFDIDDTKMFRIMLLADEVTDQVRPIGQVSRLGEIEPSTRDQTIDVTFMGRAWVEDCDRVKACKIVEGMDGISKVLRLKSINPQISANNPFEHTLVNRDRYLNYLGASKVCLAMQGGKENKGDWTFRHNEILALGRFLLMPEPRCKAPGVPIADYFKRDMSDLEEKIRYWINEEEHRKTMEQYGRYYYDQFLSPRGQANYIIKELFDAKGNTATDESPSEEQGSGRGYTLEETEVDG